MNKVMENPVVKLFVIALAVLAIVLDAWTGLEVTMMVAGWSAVKAIAVNLLFSAVVFAGLYIAITLLVRCVARK